MVSMAFFIMRLENLRRTNSEHYCFATDTFS